MWHGWTASWTCFTYATSRAFLQSPSNAKIFSFDIQMKSLSLFIFCNDIWSLICMEVDRWVTINMLATRLWVLKSVLHRRFAPENKFFAVLKVDGERDESIAWLAIIKTISKISRWKPLKAKLASSEKSQVCSLIRRWRNGSSTEKTFTNFCVCLFWFCLRCSSSHDSLQVPRMQNVCWPVTKWLKSELPTVI